MSTPEIDIRPYARLWWALALMCLGFNVGSVIDRCARGDYFGAAGSACVVLMIGVSLHLMYMLRRKWRAKP